MMASKSSDTQVCPFNESHVVLKSRIAKHVQRCAKNYPAHDLNVCLYNTTHLVFKKDLEKHMENCPSKSTADRMQFAVRSKPNINPALFAHKADVEYNEIMNSDIKVNEWDTECETNSYLDGLPQELAQKNVLRIGEMNMGKSAARTKWSAEKQRWINLEQEK